MNGILVVDKPEGPTSHDVVAKVRRALRVDKVGHTGTLDPMATGVLPLVLGRATKLARYLTGGDKSYRATIKLGITTRTLDKEGEVVLTRDVPTLDADAIEVALAALRGDILQVPPMYSAKKIDGQKLYQLARKGVDIEREAKPVSVHELSLVRHTGDELVVDVRCSAGTYVRVLAQDIGETLGCGGHLTALVRTAAGPFGLAEAYALDALLADPSLVRGRLMPVSTALGALPRIDVPSDVARQVQQGYQLSVADLRVIDAPTFAQDEALAVAFAGGEVFAVARAEIGSDDLPGSRRERRALKTERVLLQAQ